MLRIWYYSKVWGPYTKPTLPFVSYSKDVHQGERSCFQQIHNLNKLIKYDTELSLLSTLLCIEVKNVKADVYLPFLKPCHCLLNVYDSQTWEEQRGRGRCFCQDKNLAILCEQPLKLKMTYFSIQYYRCKKCLHLVLESVKFVVTSFRLWKANEEICYS